FDVAAQQMYTVFHTSEWMVCRDEVVDKALIDLGIVIPDSLQAVASGELFMKAPYKEGLDSYLWVQSYATSPYTYGFAIGNFQTLSRSYKTTQLNYLSPQYGLDLDLIFWETPKIMAFLEEISGVAYYQNTYTQVLMGAHYQEMAGMAVLKGSYGKHIIDNETEINLITHELAHQWWGNRITCQSWNHFWLNEAFATFLSAAYNEQAFGKEKYLEDIEAYRQVYLKVRDKGKDKPLVFESWHNPTREDRDIVYFKGAYVLHLLRETLGEAHFWKGLKAYSQKYFDKFVVTKNFQEEMERTSGKDLQPFFDRWVY
ncbi:MAG: M1 family aminopeptidase, partial [Bacteroidota bacterium]